ncbi:MAG: P1 family peptidase [Pseudomonadota bacterium]
MLETGPRNLITDVAGLKVGNASDAGLKSGVTVLTADTEFVAAVHVMGGAPGSRETELLAPDKLVSQVDALVLSGGSALGLSAASGVADALRAAGRGFAVGDQNVPIVPSAILFDLQNGGDKGWAENPYASLGAAALAAADRHFGLGSVGAGTGATTATLKGGLGSASLKVDGFAVGALAAVNALGSAVVGDGPHFWAAPFEIGDEFGGQGPTPDYPAPSLPDNPVDPGTATTIAIVATDAALDKSQALRMAVTAHGGLARSLVPSHTLLDGDTVFAAATGAVPVGDPVRDQMRLGHAAAICLARAVARGVHAATPAPGDTKPCWATRASP